MNVQRLIKYKYQIKIEGHESMEAGLEGWDEYTSSHKPKEVLKAVEEFAEWVWTEEAIPAEGPMGWPLVFEVEHNGEALGRFHVSLEFEDPIYVVEKIGGKENDADDKRRGTENCRR